jgi:hypothetical protein
MTLAAAEFMRRFLLHVLPAGFHRIRHYGLLANGARTASLAQARRLLEVVPEERTDAGCTDTVAAPAPPRFVCRHCGRPMLVVEIVARRPTIRAPPPAHAS